MTKKQFFKRKNKYLYVVYVRLYFFVMKGASRITSNVNRFKLGSLDFGLDICFFTTGTPKM